MSVTMMDTLYRLNEGLECDLSYVNEKLLQKDKQYPVAECIASLYNIHPDYSILAGRFAVHKLYEETETMKEFSSMVGFLYLHQMFDEEAFTVVTEHYQIIDKAIMASRDLCIDYFAFQALKKVLFTFNGQIIERPQYMWMRVALAIHKSDIDKVLQTYDYLSKHYFTLDLLTLKNACMPKALLCSGFTLQMRSDSIEGIYDTLKECATLSVHQAHVGVSINTIRARDGYIRGTNGFSNGIIPMLSVYNKSTEFTNSSSSHFVKYPNAIDEGKRKLMIYIDIWHLEIERLLNQYTSTGESRIPSLQIGIFIPDLFMHRLKEDGTWSLFCPNDVPKLNSLTGEAFEQAYLEYERDNSVTKVNARNLWLEILEAHKHQMISIMFKDACNDVLDPDILRTGLVIRSSDTTGAILQPTSKCQEGIVCAGTLHLPKFLSSTSAMITITNERVSERMSERAIECAGERASDCAGERVSERAGEFEFDFELFDKAVRHLTETLDTLLDRSTYPTSVTQRSAKQERPLSIHIDGFADMLLQLRLSFDSDEAKKLNQCIMEQLAFSAFSTSNQMAIQKGTYPSYHSSSNAKNGVCLRHPPHQQCDWKDLNDSIAKHGLRNAWLIALTSSTQFEDLTGYHGNMDPISSWKCHRHIMGSPLIVFHKVLIKELMKLRLWPDVCGALVSGKSLQQIDEIPQHIKDLFRTAFDYRQLSLVKLAADRRGFIDQGQTYTCYLKDYDRNKMSTMYMNTWLAEFKSARVQFQ